MSEKGKNHRVLPGDKLDSIEEFVPGKGSVVFGDSIVSTIAGNKSPDMTNRVMNVEPAKDVSNQIPKQGDYIIGFVDSASPMLPKSQLKQ